MQVTSWEDALSDFNTYLKGRGRRQTTRKCHVSRLRGLAAVAPAGPHAVDGIAVAAWLATLTGTSRRSAWVSARVFFAWATWAGVADSSPVPAAQRERVSVREEDRFPPAWGAHAAAFLRELEAAGRSMRANEACASYLRRFAKAFPDGPKAVGRGDVSGWMAEHPHWGTSTRRNFLMHLGRFYRWAVATGVVTANPLDGLTRPPTPRGVPRPASQTAVSGAMVDATDRDALMVLLGTLAGLRAAEIAAVRPSTDVQEGWLYVTGKGGHQRRVPLHPVLESAIAAELGRRRDTGQPGTGFRNVSQTGPDDYLFPSPGGGHVTPGAVTARLSKLLPGKATAHTLRHRFASEAYASCLDLRAVQELLGHADPKTTARYTAVPAGQLVAAVRGIR